MKQVEIKIQVHYCNREDLNKEDRELVESASRATKNAFANYSHFYVGAALRLSNGKIIIGANQENAAFPSGLCAERAAIFNAQSNYPDSPIRQIAVTAADQNGLRKRPVTPCGACRQVILEIEERYHQPVEIFLCGTEEIIRVNSVKDLLPLSFTDSDME